MYCIQLLSNISTYGKNVIICLMWYSFFFKNPLLGRKNTFQFFPCSLNIKTRQVCDVFLDLIFDFKLLSGRKLTKYEAEKNGKSTY